MEPLNTPMLHRTLLRLGKPLGTYATYTVAIGEIATLGGSFKAGILVGKIWQGSDAGYKY